VPTDIFILVGQSNIVGRCPDDGGPYYPAGTLNYTTAGAWAAISKRVLHGSVEAAADDTTFALDRQFAIDYFADNPSSTLAFIGAAEGGTGFAPGDWVKGGATYNRAVARINAALASAPGGATLKGILWHQGERDGQNDTDATAYAARLLQFIDDFRGDITGAASVPFILGGIPQQSGQFNAKVHAAVMGTRNTKLLTGYAAVDFGVEGTFIGDGVHFDAVTQRALGTQYNLGYKRAVLNTSLGGGGSVSLGTPVTANFSSGSSVTATGVALGAAAADRLILVGITARTSAFACRVKNASLAGVTLTRIVAASTLVAGGNILNWYYARIPTGTTGDLAVTFGSSAAANQVGYIVIPAYGARDPIGNVKGHGALGGGNTYGTSISVDVDVKAGGILIAQASAQQTTAPSVTLNVAGSTSRALGPNVTNAFAFEQITADSTRTVTADFSGVTVNNPSINAFTLRPAGSSGISGSAASEVSLGGAAVGAAKVEGTGGDPAVALGGSGTAAARVAGDGAGAIDVSGGATGAVANSGSGSGQMDLDGTGSASQDAGVHGAGQGDIAFQATGEGGAQIAGNAAGPLSLSGEASGAARTSGAATGEMDITGNATSGTQSPATGTAEGTLGLGGEAKASLPVRGASAALFDITGQGSETPDLDWQRLLGNHMPTPFLADARPSRFWVAA
jgi:hypothetical protein